MVARERQLVEALVVAEVEVDLAAVVEGEDLAVLKRRHRARVDVQVRVDLDRRHAVARRAHEDAERRGGHALAEARDDAARDDHVFHLGGLLGLDGGAAAGHARREVVELAVLDVDHRDGERFLADDHPRPGFHAKECAISWLSDAPEGVRTSTSLGANERSVASCCTNLAICSVASNAYTIAFGMPAPLTCSSTLPSSRVTTISPPVAPAGSETSVTPFGRRAAEVKSHGIRLSNGCCL